jgi:hypothetical protein
MNVVNRVVIVILLLVAMALCTLVLVMPVPVFEVIEQQSGTLAESLGDLEWYARVLPGVALAFVVNLVLLLLLVLEVRRPSRKAIRVEKTAGGEVQISVASIADRLRYEVDQLPGVLRTRPKVSGKRGGVVVEMDVETAAGINVPEEAEQIMQVARQVVEEGMGLKLARPPRVNLRAVSYPKAQKSPAKPKEAPPAEPKEEALPVEPVEMLPVEPAEWSPVEPEEALSALPEDFAEQQTEL